MSGSGNLGEALRFWEGWRAPYNLALVAVAVGVTFAAGQNWRFLSELAPMLYLAAILANLLYCAAYPVDLMAQASAFAETWRRRRWIFWAFGTLIAGALLGAVLLVAASPGID